MPVPLWRLGADAKRRSAPIRGRSQPRQENTRQWFSTLRTQPWRAGRSISPSRRSLPIPLGWAINAAGEPTTDPQEAIDGTILPLAEHKGYAIAMLMDVFSGVLTGSSFGSAVNGPYQFERRSGCGHLMIALNIEAFQPLGLFNGRMEELIEQTKAVPPANGFDEVLYPGEPEARNEKQNRERGLELPKDTLADLRKVAERIGLVRELPF